MHLDILVVVNHWVNQLELVREQGDSHEALAWDVLVKDKLDSFLLVLLEGLQHQRVYTSLIVAEDYLDLDLNALAMVTALEHDLIGAPVQRLQLTDVDLQ
jgi:hypothetical protein